jgi:hypothetical protein
LTKIGWAKLWTIFSQTHLVTLSEGEMTMVTPVTHSLRHFLRIKKRGLGITGPHWKKVLFKWPRLQRPFTDLILLALMRLSGSLAFGLFIAFFGLGSDYYSGLPDFSLYNIPKWEKSRPK